MTKHHIDWHERPMNVKLAAQTISRSVANILKQLCKDGYEEFKHSAVTSELLLQFNDVFDIQNYADKGETNNEYKQHINNQTAEKIFKFAETFKNYVDEIEVEIETKKGLHRKPVLQSESARGFFGFYNNFISLEGIYTDFVKNGPLEFFEPFQFSQDHLETFFSLIRNSQGRNDNPSTVEFSSAFKKLLICHPIITSVGHNVITNATGILTTSSRIQKRPLPAASAQSQAYELEVDYATLIKEENDNMEPFEEHITAYVALCTEEKIIYKMNHSNKYKCSDCINLLHAPGEKISDQLLAMKTGESQPCASTVKIIVFSNAILKLISAERTQGNDFNAIWKTIYNLIDFDDLYGDEDFSQHHNELSSQWSHKENFVINIIKIYLTLKSVTIGNKVTDEERGELIRHRRKRAVLNSGQ